MHGSVPAGLLVGVSLVLASCAVINSSRAVPHSSGLVYSLPKGQVLLKAQRKQVTAEDAAAAQKAATDLAALVEADTKALAEAKKKLDFDQAQAAADPSVRAKLLDIVAVDKALVAVLTATLSRNKENAAAAKTKADNAVKSVGSLQETATLTVLDVVPDPDPQHRYVADLKHLPTRDEDLKLSVINGLLTSSTISSTDQTANILVQLAGTIAAFTGVPAAPSIPLAPAAPAPTPEVAKCLPYEFATVFDPTDAGTIAKAKEALQTAGQPTVLTLNVPRPSSPC